MSKTNIDSILTLTKPDLCPELFSVIPSLLTLHCKKFKYNNERMFNIQLCGSKTLPSSAET